MSDLGRCDVFVDAAVLHDDEEGAVGVGEQADVGDGVAVDQEQVGQRARLDDAEAAGVYQRVILASTRPWRAARGGSNRMSEPRRP